MTAINLVLRPEAAFLATDSAFYDGNGIVRGFGPKAVALPHWPAAIATRGSLRALYQLAAELSVTFSDMDAFALVAPEYLEGFVARHAATLAATGMGVNLEIVAAGWSPEREAPRAFMVTSADHGDLQVVADPAGEELIEAKPYHLTNISDGSMLPTPSVEALAVRGVDLSAEGIDEVDPMELLTTILLAQRELTTVFYPGGPEVHHVGGYACQFIITRGGVTSICSKPFDDAQPGKPLPPVTRLRAPTATKPNVVPMNRAERRAAARSARKH